MLASMHRLLSAFLSVLAVFLGSFSCGVLSAAEPGTATETEAANLAEPNWPIGFKFTPETMDGWKRAKRMLGSPKADVLVWLPEGAKQLRAILLIPNNTDSKIIGEHDRIREICAKHLVGIVYLRHVGGAVIERSDPPTTAEHCFGILLDEVAKRTGIVEFKHAPWVTFGKSSRGRFPFRCSWWFPKRVVASISYHGETPNWPAADWAKVGDESIMHLAINGLTEWDGTWYRHVRPGLLNYHHNTNWLAHQLVIYGVGHGNYIDMHGSEGWGQKVPGKNVSCKKVWNYLALFIDRAMQLRVPTDVWATEAPIALKQVDRDQGWLIHPRAPEELLGLKWFAFRENEQGAYETIKWPDEVTPVYDSKQGTVPAHELIVPAASVAAEQRDDYLWVPDRGMASAWLALHDIYKQRDRVLPKPEQPEQADKP